MDFSALLAVASKNNVLNEKLVTKNKTGYNTSLAPAKRQAPSRPKGVLSEKVKAFLEKQEKEEKAKAAEEKKKKDALLKKRQEAKNKANASARKDQSGSKSSEEMREERERLVKEKLEEKRKAIIEKLKEAETKGNKRSSSASTSTVSSAPEFVSEKQRRADKKLMEKYDKEVDSDSEEEIRCDVLSPSKQILDREGYEKREMKRRKELAEKYKSTGRPILKQKTHTKHKDKHKEKHKDKHKEKHKHKDKHKDKHRDKHRDKHDKKHHDDKDGKPKVEKETKLVPRKPKFIRPNNNRPVLSFQDLLSMASKKQNKILGGEAPEPAAGPKEVDKKEAVPPPKPPKNERPMTQEEKDRYARRQTKEYKDWLKNGGVLAIGKGNQQGTPATQNERESRPPHGVERTKTQEKLPSMSQLPSERGTNGRTSLSAIPVRPSSRPSGSAPSSQGKPQSKATPGKSAEKAPATAGVKRDSAGNLKKAEPPQEFSNPFDRIMGSIRKDHPKKEKRPRVIDSEEEEDDLDDFIADDEDDDFIDDSEAQDYSSIIRDMFKYNPNKYKDEDEDLRSMDVGYAQVAREEKRSAKIGLQEDLEDIRREKEEERLKMLRRKKMKLKMKGR